MATSRESFPVLESTPNGDGAVLRQMQEGDSSSAKNGLLAFSFKDSTGNAILPQLSPQGAFYVDSTAAGVDKMARGTVTPTLVGVANIADVATLTMTNSKTYTELNVIVSCRRDAFFQLVYDNGTLKIPLADFILGPGQYTATYSSLHFTQAAGATGINAIKVVGFCFDKATDMYATISCVESA